MFKHFLRHLFVPHEGNDHRPHLLRPKTIGLLVVAALAIEGAFLVQTSNTASSRLFALVLPDALVAQTNGERANEGAGVLKTNALLTQAAQAKANDMATKSYFAHQSPDGRAPWDWIVAAGYRFAHAGENLAINFSDSEDVTRAWMNSPLHRQNMLNNDFTEIGIATAKGVYEGRTTTFVVQMFGRPAISAVTPIAVAPPPPAPKPTPTPAPQPAPAPTPVTPPPAPEEPIPASQETFIAVRGAESAPLSVNEEAAQSWRQGVATLRASLIEGLAASPRTSVKYIYIVLAALVAFALVLKAQHSVRRHPHLILGGLAFLLLVTAITAVNQYVALKDAQVYGVVYGSR